jgi:hypothetical protein
MILALLCILHVYVGAPYAFFSIKFYLLIKNGLLFSCIVFFIIYFQIVVLVSFGLYLFSFGFYVILVGR